ncbi:composite domain of metallo-dependent hydrolase [Schizopora paradoxa]|uniref:Composite domain of metallo-dependent hydrolase n=1 Tax=Schizopora paradoxa TaxID=27342 RepID=A0A0H2S782_9AGAM|nr:composite domain of metallo-dependent hydrolase [Schizopora paradoxa]
MSSKGLWADAGPPELDIGNRNGKKANLKTSRVLWRCLAGAAAYLLLSNLWLKSQTSSRRDSIVTYAPDVLARCASLNATPSPPANFHARKTSDRFQEGTRPTLITNAKVWTGDEEGTRVLDCADILLDHGLVRWIGNCGKPSSALDGYGSELSILDASGAWLTPGIVDLHSHLAVGSSPSLNGAEDGNSLKGSAQPWLRSLDGLNTHDDAYALAIAGGVTTSLILPGSANAIGGQAFVMKWRPTTERSPTSMLLEPPLDILNASSVDHSAPPRWRHMKHACGENPSRVYGQTRMDTFWQFRKAYDTARQLKERQDLFCSKALKGERTDESKFPDDLQWEALVDVLRGRVKVQTHCYEAVDLDDFVRLSNEFQFPVAAFHHAHETYLVPEVLKRAYGDVKPASAMFAAFSRYKRESYRHSEFAPRILNDNGLRVVMKSDHSAIVSRYLLHEAQQAHYYGLPPNIALMSVITTPAEVMGLGHRIGYVREGHDADLVLWDSHPLQIGATPTQVFIDGIPQLENPYHVHKSPEMQETPMTPNFDKEASDAVKHVGLPPLEPTSRISDDFVVFTNVSAVWTRDALGVPQVQDVHDNDLAVAVHKGRIINIGSFKSCSRFAEDSASKYTVVDISGGAISPGLVSYGTSLGLQEIGMEASTTDGTIYDLAFDDVPSALRDGPIIKAVDGLQLSTRDELLAYRAGVTSAITPPIQSGFFGGLSVYFSTGAEHSLVKGAVIKDVAAFHVSIGHSNSGRPSVSTQIGVLRKLLTLSRNDDHGQHVANVMKGEIPLVVDVHSADIIASLISLKKEVQESTGSLLKMTITGATEAHILAKELAEANVGVILNPVRPFPYFWDARRIMPGPPLSQDSALVHLLQHNVTVGLGVMGIGTSTQISAWSARNTRFDVSWAMAEAGGYLSKSEAIAIASSNVEKLLGISPDIAQDGDFVVTSGADLFDLQSKVVAVISPRREQVELL